MDIFSRFALQLLCALALAAGGACFAAPADAQRMPAAPAAADYPLPPEARETLQLIRRGGPFPYERDGAVFGNYEKRLPARDRGYYREYTVRTPGARDRGARRIIAGGCKPGQQVERGSTSVQFIAVPCARAEWYYTDDHYRSFHRLTP
jgi:ribonuclease T1